MDCKILTYTFWFKWLSHHGDTASPWKGKGAVSSCRRPLGFLHKALQFFAFSAEFCSWQSDVHAHWGTSVIASSRMVQVPPQEDLPGPCPGISYLWLQELQGRSWRLLSLVTGRNNSLKPVCFGLEIPGRFLAVFHCCPSYGYQGRLSGELVISLSPSNIRLSILSGYSAAPRRPGAGITCTISWSPRAAFPLLQEPFGCYCYSLHVSRLEVSKNWLACVLEPCNTVRALQSAIALACPGMSCSVPVISVLRSPGMTKETVWSQASLKGQTFGSGMPGRPW